MESAAGAAPVRRAALAATTAVAGCTALATAAAVWQRLRRRQERLALPPAAVGGGGGGGDLSWVEVARHAQADDLWLVVDGEVYDVTPWLEDHPGGRLLLLAFAGRDASDAFGSIGHSALARREMRRLHKGRVHHATPQAAALMPAAGRLAGRRATLTGGPSGTSDLTRASSKVEVDLMDEASQDGGDLWNVEEHGFLPRNDPVGVEALHGTGFEVFARLADDLPSLGITGELRTMLDTDLDLQRRMRAATDDVELLQQDEAERAFAVVGYTMVAYWRSGKLEHTQGLDISRSSGGGGCAPQGGSCAMDASADHLPAFLAEPMLALSKRLQRPPMVDYASTVLYNWVRIDPAGPISMTNVRCAVRLTGLLDEEWFFKTHVVIESEASHVISAVIGAMRAAEAEEESELLEHLVSLEDAMWRVVRACLPIMYERDVSGTPKCCPDIFYTILRPLIKSGDLVFEGESGPRSIFLNGPSGAMSTLLPAVDAALGIKMTSDKLRAALEKFELSMPRGHREFLAKLRGQTSIRQRLMLFRPEEGIATEQHAALVRSFNRCVSRVLDFRWQHWTYVKNFILRPGNISHGMGSGGTTFDYLQQHITDTERARLTERAEGFLRTVSSPGEPEPALPPLRLPPEPLRLHPSLEFWSVDSQHGLLSREPLMGPRARDWTQGLSPALRDALVALNALARRLPALCTSEGPFRREVEATTDRLAALQDDRLLLGMPEMGREHLMVTLCHVAAGCCASQGGEGKKLPKCVDRPLQLIARSVGRPPRLEFTELVLANWCPARDMRSVAASSSSRPPAADGRPSLSSPLGPLRVAWRFLACPDEEWYRAVHIVLHEQARDLVSAIRVGQVAICDQNDLGVVGSLESISAWLNKFCDFFDGQFENKDSRTESVTFMRMEPFISHSSSNDLTLEETACWVYMSGSSPILPAVHAFLGVRFCAVRAPASPEADRLAEHLQHLVEECRTLMPRLHRVFVEELEKPGASLRQYSFQRFGNTSASVEQMHDLEVAYNDALNALVRYLSRRVHLVSRAFPALAVHFGIYHGEIEAFMRRSRLELLKMRRRAHRCLER